MIQRIQSVWLFIASMLSGLLFIFPLFHYRAFTPTLMPVERFEGVRNYLPLLLMAAAITLLPLISIFFFGDRKRQRGFVWLCIVLCVAFIAFMVMRYANISNMSGLSWSIPGPVFPEASIIFLIMALRGIRHDEKLVKSMDRLR